MAFSTRKMETLTNMEINSSIARVDHSTEQLFSKLSSVETYEGLMPEGAAFIKN